MNKLKNLFKLREWFTISEAAKHLSNIFGEEVNETDVLRLGLDGHLKLSVYFVNHAWARCGKVVPYKDVEWIKIRETLDNLVNNNPFFKKNDRTMKSINIGNHKYLNLEEDVKIIGGVWDLAMVGGEALDIEHKYQSLIGGPSVTLVPMEGAFVVGPDGEVCQLQESFDDNELTSGSKAQLEGIKEYIISKNIEKEKAAELLINYKKDREKYLAKLSEGKKSDGYYPAGGLPSDSVLVIRTQAIIDLQNQLMGIEKITQSQPIIESLTSKEKQEFGRLKVEKNTMDATIKAAIEVGRFIQQKESLGEKIIKKEITDLIYKIDKDIPNTRIDLIWRLLPDTIKHGPGRPKEKNE